jgi:hypothetical protein
MAEKKPTLRDRYIEELNTIVGRGKPFRNMIAYSKKTGDNYSTLTKVVNINSYDDMIPTVRMLQNLCLHGNKDGHYLLTGQSRRPKDSSPLTVEERIDRLEKAVFKKKPAK